MRPIATYLKNVTLLFFIAVTSASAQTISSQKGLTTAVFNVPPGIIKVYLPDDIRSGDIITGTVIAEPNGATEKEKNRNRVLLQKYNVNAGAVITPVSNQRRPIKFIIKEFESTLISLSDNKTAAIGSFPVSIISNTPPQPTTITVPTHAITGSALRITGPFDGDATNTKCLMDEKEMEILAESPHQTICLMPPTTSGPHSIEVEEKGSTTKKKISAVNLDLSAPKTNLLKGEKTTIKVAVAGLEGIASSVKLIVTNTSPSTINLSGGNTQVINITPSQVGSNGTYSQTLEVQSLTTGNFTVNADLQLPESTTGATANHYVACAAANGVLLPQQECERLAALMNQANPPSPSGTTASSPSTAAQLKVTTQGSTHTFNIQPADGVMITAVIWTVTYRGQENSLLKADTIIKTNTSSVQVANSDLPGAANTIHATVYSNSAPSVTLSYPVIKYYNSSLYAATSSVIDQLEKQRDAARAKSDAEWEKVQAAQTERDNLTNTTAGLKKAQGPLAQTAAALEELDEMLEQTGPMYMNEMKGLVDSLTDLLKNNPPSGINWRERCAKLEQKMIDCQSQVSALNDELQQLNNSIAQMLAARSTAFSAGVAAIKNAGYGAFGNQHFDKDGNMTPEFGIIIVSSGGQKASVVRGIPPGAATQVSAQQQKIKDLNKAIQDAKDRKKEIEEMLKNLPAQCAELIKQLEDCRKEQEKASAAYQAQRDYEWELWDLCDKIMKMFAQLQGWCKANRKICNVDEKIDELAKNCPPKDPQQFQQYWNTIQQIITYKKGIEESYSSQAETTAQQIINNEQEIKRLDSIAMAHRDSMWNASSAATAAQQQINDEVNRQKAAATQAANERRRQLKTTCAEFMQSQMKEGEANGALLETISAIKSEIEKIGSVLTGGSAATDGLGIYNEAKGSKEALLKRLALLQSRLEALAEAMKGIAELAGYAEDISKIAESIAALSQEGNDALTNANKFGAILASLNVVLGHINQAFPILGFFTSYLSYLADGYNAGVNGAKEIGGIIVRREAYKLVQTTDCAGMVDEYGKQKKVEDVVALLMKRFNNALTNSGIKIEPYNKTQLQLFEEELRKAIIRKMLDCCLKWVTTEG